MGRNQAVPNGPNWLYAPYLAVSALIAEEQIFLVEAAW